MAKARSRREQRYLEAKARTRRRVAAGIGAAVLAGVVVLVIVLSSGGGGSNAFVVQLTLDDYTITGDLEVPAGELELVASNVGEIPHNVGLVGGPIGRDLRPGERDAVNIGELEPGTYELYCDIAGHVDLGMVATLTVTEPSDTEEPETEE